MHFSLSLSIASVRVPLALHARYDVTHVRCKLIARNRLFADFVAAVAPKTLAYSSAALLPFLVGVVDVSVFCYLLVILTS